MKILLAWTACSLALATQFQTGPAMPETPWYPLKVGNKWYYRVIPEAVPGQKKEPSGKNKNGDPAKRVVMEVKELAEIELMKDGKAEKTSAYRIVGVSGDREDPKQKNQTDRQLIEHIGVYADGVYRFAGSDKDITPPLRILKLPPAKGDSWECNIPLERGPVKGTFTIREEKISVLAGTYETMHVSGEFMEGSQKMTADYWFASGVGIVKQKIQRGTFTVELELEKFEPAGSK